MNNHMEVFEEGISFYEKLKKMNLDSLKLGSEVVYNMVCIAAEAFLSALLLKHNKELEHGSVPAMLKSASSHVNVSAQLMEEARFMARFHTWCAMDAVPSKQATSEELKRMVLCVAEIMEVVKGNIIQTK